MKINRKTGTWEFKNKSTKETDNLYFFLYDYDHDSIMIKYRAQDTTDDYPIDKVENNIFYKIYDDLRIKKGIKHISITVPGYSHTFKAQVNTFMRRMKMFYGDSTNLNAAFILYAWGDEWRPYRYYRAKSSAQRGANDFAIFQHMLEDFLSDSVFFTTHPKDISVFLTCTSMGNQLLKKYLLEREKVRASHLPKSTKPYYLSVVMHPGIPSNQAKDSIILARCVIRYVLSGTIKTSP